MASRLDRYGAALTRTSTPSSASVNPWGSRASTRPAVAAGELLDLADAVAQRVAMAVQPPGGGLPLAVGLDERLERAHQLTAVVAFPAFDRAKQRVAVQAQRVGVLQREQQLEGAEV